ncbi:MAG TPA: HetP family heterocyst commitment protein [Coleofasciculaceae cyanobacterium]
MRFSAANPLTNYSKAMTTDQFDQVVAAISEGRYSWACVLILRFAGYNPVHFIPIRTYNRLLKENRQRQTPLLQGNNQRSMTESHPVTKHLSVNRELEYTEAIEGHRTQGGHLPLGPDRPWSLWKWIGR